jgi:DNA-binding response OmpR family regulator
MMSKILIAEDERDIRDLIDFTLSYNGYEVISASNGEDALELIQREMPDLILLDVRMPRKDGYEVCKALKTEPSTSGIPVVFLSAKGQEAEVEAGLQLGAEAYILKPFSPNELVVQVGNLLREGTH